MLQRHPALKQHQQCTRCSSIFILTFVLMLHSLMPKGAGSRPTWRPFRDLQHKHKKCVLQFVFLILWKMQFFLERLNICIFYFLLLLLFPLFSFIIVVVVVVVVVFVVFVFVVVVIVVIVVIVVVSDADWWFPRITTSHSCSIFFLKT